MASGHYARVDSVIGDKHPLAKGINANAFPRYSPTAWEPGQFHLLFLASRLRRRTFGGPSDCLVPCKHRPEREDDDSSNHCANKAGTFARAVKSKGLAEIAGDEGADDAQDCCQYETRGLILAGHEKLGDDASDKPDDDGPENAH